MGEYTNLKCPRCRCPLLTNGTELWCSFTGDRRVHPPEYPCLYGLDQPVPLEQLLPPLLVVFDDSEIDPIEEARRDG